MKRVLITGASGFIGRALTRRLEGAGVRTVCTSRHPVHSVPGGPTWVLSDLSQPDEVMSLVRMARADVVFHLAAAVTGARSLDVVLPTVSSNLVTSINVLRAVTEVGCDRIVLIGSGDEPEDSEAPASPYAAAKWAVAGYARMFHALYGTPVATARPFMVYGPDQPDESKLVPYVITSLLRHQPPRLSSGARQCDWIYIDDVVDALLAVAVAPTCLNRVVDVGTGHLHTVRHVVEALADRIHSDVRPIFGAVPDRPRETEAVADIAEAERLSGWSPVTSLDEGLGRTLAWFEDAITGRTGQAR